MIAGATGRSAAASTLASGAELRRRSLAARRGSGVVLEALGDAQLRLLECDRRAVAIAILSSRSGPSPGAAAARSRSRLPCHRQGVRSHAPALKAQHSSNIFRAIGNKTVLSQTDRQFTSLWTVAPV